MPLGFWKCSVYVPLGTSVEPVVARGVGVRVVGVAVVALAALP